MVPTGSNRKVILTFYPADWSPVCDDQMTLYNEMLNYFTRHNAQLIGISIEEFHLCEGRISQILIEIVRSLRILK